jgi:hypothetical protein
MVAASLRRRPTLYGGASLLLALAVALTACGGKDRQDKDEKEGTWKVQVVSASFPGKQILADTTELQIKVKNEDSRTLPNLTVTVDGFDRRDEGKQFGEPRRPIWVIDDGPTNSTTAYTNTWAVGPVPAGQTRTLKWKVTAVRAGTYTLRWRVAAGLNGKAKAVLADDGGAAKGEFVAQVSGKARPFNAN